MIYDKTRKTAISRDFSFCKSVISRAIGMMFRLKPKSLVFAFNKEKLVPLHMIFVFFPIDIAYLDKNKVVVEIKRNFKPFSFYTPKKKAMYILELPAGTIENARLSVGDRIRF